MSRTIGDIEISKQAIMNAMEYGDWCQDWRLSVTYFMRNREKVTVRKAHELFDDDTYYHEVEGECPHCGSTTYEEKEEDNPQIDYEAWVRFFRDAGDKFTSGLIEAAGSYDDDPAIYLEIGIPDGHECPWEWKEPKPAPAENVIPIADETDPPEGKSTYTRYAIPIPYKCRHAPECVTAATLGWYRGNYNSPDYVCDEHLAAHGIEVRHRSDS